MGFDNYTFEKIETELWSPTNIDDEIVGKLLKVEYDKGAYKSKVYTLEDGDGKPFAVFGSTVLDDKMIPFKEGDIVKIVFRGLIKGKDKEYKEFDVYRGKEGK